MLAPKCALFVAGLAADLAGFSLLALDVTREYSRYRLVERFRVGADAAERCKIASPAPTKLVHDDPVIDLRSHIQKLEATLDKATAISTWERSLSLKERKNFDPYKPDWQQIATGLVTKADQLAAQPHKWAPIRLGIFMVLVGFALQVVGAIPC